MKICIFLLYNDITGEIICIHIYIVCIHAGRYDEVFIFVKKKCESYVWNCKIVTFYYFQISRFKNVLQKLFICIMQSKDLMHFMRIIWNCWNDEFKYWSIDNVDPSDNISTTSPVDPLELLPVSSQIKREGLDYGVCNAIP